jgi:hypothetical protein
MASRHKKNPVKRLITNRDYQMLKCLWKWKLLSTRALAKKYFQKASPFTAYIRLLRLEAAGFIEFVQIDDPGFGVWTLTPKGFRVIRSKMVDLVKDGYKSMNPYHDYLATAFHLGEWLTGQPEGSQTFSEQQLLRIGSDLWPSWIPHSKIHRPDGYSLCCVNGQKVVTAFEAELTLKSKRKYEPAVAFYDSEPSIHFVFWLIKSRGVLASIQNAFEKCEVREWTKHHFVLLETYREKGWSAPFIAGTFQGRAMKEILRYNAATTLLQCSYTCSTLELLDIRKRPMNPVVSGDLKKR